MRLIVEREAEINDFVPQEYWTIAAEFKPEGDVIVVTFPDVGYGATQGATECNAKVIEFARANTNAAFDYANELLGVKSPSDFLKVASEHARKQFETFSAQTKELTALSQKAMLEAAEPLKAGAAKVFKGPLA